MDKPEPVRAVVYIDKTGRATFPEGAAADKLSVRAFARLVGTSPTTIIRYRRGEELDMPTARKILPYMDKCPCCGVTISPTPEGE